MIKNKINITELSELLNTLYNAGNRSGFEQIFADITEDIDSEGIDNITIPLTSQMAQLSKEGKLTDYFTYLSNARSYLYRNHLNGPKPPYFKVKANPDLSAYVLVGNNSFETVEDNTLLARMEGA